MKAKKLTGVILGASLLIASQEITAWPKWIDKLVNLVKSPAPADTCPVGITHAITDNITAQLTQRLGKPDDNTIDDASCLNKTSVFAIVQPTQESHIKEVVDFAQAHDMHVSVAAVRHSMGGQAFFPNSIILDMTTYNKILSLDKKEKTVHVQAGTTWEIIQDHIDEFELSIKAMQSSNIFSVGGSMSVNAHGMDHKAGSVSQTIKSFRMMMADGTIKTISPTQEPKLFSLVLGGYGLFGIILDAAIELTDNVAYMPSIKIMKTNQLSKDLNNILNDPNIGIFYAHLSTSPLTLLNDAVLYMYERPSFTAKPARLGQAQHTRFKRLILNVSKKREYGRYLKWFLEKHVDKFMQQCKHPILKHKCLISRNELMHDSVPYLQHALLDSVDILQEYFVSTE